MAEATESVRTCPQPTKAIWEASPMLPLFRGSVLVILFAAGLATAAAAADAAGPPAATASQTDPMPPFGSQENEQRLIKIIKETIAPKPAERKTVPPELAHLLAWSEPVNGLAARVEYASRVDDGWHDVTELPVLVRVKNVSERLLTVPTGNPKDKNVPQPFELHTQLGTGPWRQTKLSADRYFQELGRETTASQPTVTLKPGEHCVVYVCGIDPEENAEPRNVKANLRWFNKGEKHAWSGILETPPHPATGSSARPTPLAGLLPFSNYFPAFTDDVTPSGNMSDLGTPQGPTDLRSRFNHPTLIEALALYDPAGVRKEFERRMQAEKSLPMKLLLATVAARAGSEQAGLFLLESMKNTNYRTVDLVQDALIAILFDYYGKEPPDWIVELMLAALCDDRMVTGLQESYYAPGMPFTISSRAEKLAEALGFYKCRKAVPALIDLAKKTNGSRGSVIALGQIGDNRTIPVVMDFLRIADKEAQGAKTSSRLPRSFDEMPEDLAEVSGALAQLKVREAVPILLQYIEYVQVIWDLEEIGDPRAVPALRDLVTAEGKIVKDGKTVLPEFDNKRLFAAKVALAYLEQGDTTARLCELLADKSVEQFPSHDLVMRLGRSQNPKAIPTLIAVIKTDSDHYAISSAIFDLAKFKYKAAVEGLIECFDVNFKGHRDKGGVSTPRSRRNDIARSLQQITGQTFGADKQQWLKWWQEEGRKSAELK